MTKTETSAERPKKAVSDEFVDEGNSNTERGTEVVSSSKSIAWGEEDDPTESKDKQKKDHVEQAKNARCLFLKNVPYKATKKDILQIFRKATNVQFPGGTQHPSKGIAFVEFQNKTIAMKERQKKQGVKIQDRLLVVDIMGKTKATNSSQVTKAKGDNSTKVRSKTLMVRGLSKNTTAETLRCAFEGAMGARIAVDKDTGVSKRFGFVDFKSEDICKAAKEYMEDCVIDGNKVILDYAKTKTKSWGATGGLVGHPARQVVVRRAGQGRVGGRSGRHSREGRRRGAGTLLDAV